MSDGRSRPLAPPSPRSRARSRGGTFDLASAPYPTKMALGGVALSPNPNPYVKLMPRMLVIRSEDFEGNPKTLVRPPLIPEGSLEAPVYAHPLTRPERGEAVGPSRSI